MGPSSNTASQLTAPGTSAIAVVRLAGPAVPGFLAAHFDRQVRPGRCVHGNLTEDGEVIDDPVVAWVDHEAVDLNLHGGTAVVRAVLDLARRGGYEVESGPGDAGLDFGRDPWRRTSPRRSVESADDLGMEVLVALRHARTEEAVRSLLAQPKAWAALSPAAAEAAAGDLSGRWLVRTPTVAIVGPANVGKSTLANRLYGQDRAITADRPGTTRDWVGAVADLGGLAVTLVDTPGMRATDDAIERAAVAAAAGQIAMADLVVVVVDGSVQPTADARAVLDSHPGAIVVSNKADRAEVWAVPGAIRVSAATGDGVDELSMAVRRRFGWETVQIDRARWWTERQRAILHSFAYVS